MILLRFFVTFAPRLREFLGTEQHHVLHGRRVGTTPRLCHKIKIITTEKYMYFTGITIAVLTFLTIGIWHPIVIKTEYYWGTRPWIIYLIIGLSCIVAALFIANVYLSAFLGVFGASALWGIGELFAQKRRVEKGWFPKNSGLFGSR